MRVTTIATLIAAASTAGLMVVSANAASCQVPNNIANGQVADATKVMENFDAVADCAEQAVTTTGSLATGSVAVFSGARTISSGNLSGDVTTSGSTATTLANSGVTAGAYTNANIIVDAKGRITSAASGTGGGSGALVYLGSLTASNSGALDITALISSSYDIYILEFSDIVLSANGAALTVNFSSDNGATWDTGANYDTAVLQTNPGTYSGNSGVTSGNYGQITHAFSTSTGNAISGNLKLYAPLGAHYKFALLQSATQKTDGYLYNNSGSIRYKNTAMINAIRLQSSSGNISSGSVYIYGLSH